MIFVISGSQKFQLNRLYERIDQQIEKGIIRDPIFAQIGASQYRPKHYEYVDFLAKNAFEEKISQADMIITHSGVGAILSSLKKGKRVIVFPRLPHYHEIVDNHQMEIAENFEKLNYVMVCRDSDDLGEMIERCKTYPFAEYQPKSDGVISVIRDFLGSLD